LSTPVVADVNKMTFPTRGASRFYDMLYVMLQHEGKI